MILISSVQFPFGVCRILIRIRNGTLMPRTWKDSESEAVICERKWIPLRTRRLVMLESTVLVVDQQSTMRH